MKYTVLVVILLVSILSSTAHAVDPGPATHIVTLEITIEDEEFIEGEIEIELFGNEAPVTVANFLEYADSNFYDGLLFHRVMPTFMIQGGGYERFNSSLNERPTNWPIINESYNGLLNRRGTVAMARTSEPNSATSQFFINHQDNQDRSSFVITEDNPGYCVFGRVTDGMDFVDTIAQLDTVNTLPILDVVINRVRIPQIYVATDGDDITGDGSEGNPYATIQKSVDMAEKWVPVILMPGVYTGPGNRDIDFNGKAITVRCLGPEDPHSYYSNNNIAATVIYPGPHRAFYFHSGEGSDSVVEGITIAGGYAENGAGIYCRENSSPTIRNCVIVDNHAVSDGGGIYCENSSPVIKNCNIFDNHAGRYGAAICSTGSTPKIINSIIWDNTGPDIIHGPADVTFCDVQGGHPSLGNINTDPHFADPDNGNFYLKSQNYRWNPSVEQWVSDNVTSRCIDAGCPGSRIMYEYDPRRINMGTYGDTRKASGSLSLAIRPDINNDNIVNFKDFAAMVSYWLMESPDLPGDFNRDGIVSSFDLFLFSNRWLQTTAWYPTLPADFNKDGVVNFADFAYIASAWYLVAERAPADFDENQIVDSADLALFAQSWLHTKAEHPILPADLNNDNIVNFADFAYLARDWQKTPYQLPAELDLDENQTLDITDLASFANSWLDTELWYE